MTWSNGMGHILVQMHMQAGLNLTGHWSTKTVDNNNKRLAFSRSVWIKSDSSFDGKGTYLFWTRGVVLLPLDSKTSQLGVVTVVGVRGMTVRL